MSLNKTSPFIILSLAAIFSSCLNNSTNISKTNKNDIIIHQLRVELEELKHHLHTNSVQINILSNKIINNEDTILDLTQKEFITHKQTLEKSMETLAIIQDKITSLAKADDSKSKSIENLEEKLSTQEKSVIQNKNKIREIAKNARDFQENSIIK